MISNLKEKLIEWPKSVGTELNLIKRISLNAFTGWWWHLITPSLYRKKCHCRPLLLLHLIFDINYNYLIHLKVIIHVMRCTSLWDISYIVSFHLLYLLIRLSEKTPECYMAWAPIQYPYCLPHGNCQLLYHFNDLHTKWFSSFRLRRWKHKSVLHTYYV